MVAAGLLSEEDAMASPGAHVVTALAGRRRRPSAEPHVATFEPPGPGVLLLCSDGLWNYRPGAAELAALALPAGAGPTRWRAAAALVGFALDAGGHGQHHRGRGPVPPIRAARQRVPPSPCPGSDPDSEPRGEPADEPA